MHSTFTLYTFTLPCSPEPPYFVLFSPKVSFCLNIISNVTIMAVASLVFPACCLALSFLFVVAVYYTSTKERVKAFHHGILLPAYKWVKQKFTSRAHETTPTSVATYEAIPPVNDSTDGKESHEIRDEQEPSPERPWFFPRSQTRNREASPLGVSNSRPEGSNSSHTNRPSNAVFFANRTVASPNEGESFVIEPARNADPNDFEYDPNDYGSDEYDSDSDDASNAPGPRQLAYNERRGPEDLPSVWQYELEQPVYVIDHAASSVWVAHVVEWTAQTAFALVAPPLVLENMDESYGASEHVTRRRDERRRTRPSRWDRMP